MSFLMVEQLENNDVIETKIKLTNSSTFTSIRLGLYKKGNPDCDLTIRIYEGANLLATALLTSEKLNSISGTYFHGSVNIEFDYDLEINLTTNLLELTAEISLSNYVDSDSQYLALLRNPNPVVPVFGDVNPVGQESEDIWLSPFDIELFSYRG